MNIVRDPSCPESFLVESVERDAANSVRTTTLDKFFDSMGWPQLDVLKMNIEGGELRALYGMRQLSRRSPTLQLVMEFNPTALHRAGASKGELDGTLKDLGFRRGQIVERGLE